MTYLVQMKQSNKCGSVRNDKIPTYPCNLVQAIESAFPAPARHHPHLLISSAQTINQEKSKSPEMRFTSQQIELYCLGLQSWPTYTGARAKRARFETQP